MIKNNDKIPYGARWEAICKMGKWGTSQEQDDALMAYVRELQDENKLLKSQLDESTYRQQKNRIEALQIENSSMTQQIKELLSISFIKKELESSYKKGYEKGQTDGYISCNKSYEEYRFNGECGIG